MRNKIKGALFGLACGDALGAAVEFMTPEEIKAKHGEVREILGGGKFCFKKGEVTDDTDMTLCVARGILKEPVFPMEAIGDEFLSWQKGRPKDIGMIVQFAISFYTTNYDWSVAAKKTHDYLGGKSAGNGSLMRTLPVALAYKNLSKVEHITKAQSDLTHFDNLASEACLIYNRIAYRLLNGEALKEAITKEVSGTIYERILNESPSSVPDGFVVNSLSWSLYTLLHTTSFEEVLIRAVNMGYDADTTGSIVGGLAGIYYGFESIPSRWVETLLKKEEMEKTVEELIKLRSGN